MAKADSKKVSIAFGEAVVATGKDLQSLYSQAVILSYRNTGRLAPPFNSNDLVAWVRENYPNDFDEKGHRIN